MSAPTFVPGGQGTVDMHATSYNSTPCASEQTQPMGSDFRMEPVNVYTSSQQEKLQQHLSYGDHRIADPKAQIGLEEWMNLPEQLVSYSDMVEAAKALHKVVIEKFDSTKLQWT